MYFNTATLALSAVLGSSIAAAQTVHVVWVSSTNGSLTYSPDNVKAAAGDMVQFQFMAGNHTVTQSTFDQPCEPIDLNSNVTGFHSGFMDVAASASTGMIPTYTILINNTTPIWAYCSQAKHCEAGMSMVINENTAANASRSLANYKAAAAKVSKTIIPGGGANSSEGGVTGSTTASGSATVSSASASASASGSSAGSMVHAPTTAAAGGLLLFAAAFFSL